MDAIHGGPALHSPGLGPSCSLRRGGQCGVDDPVGFGDDAAYHAADRFRLRRAQSQGAVARARGARCRSGQRDVQHPGAPVDGVGVRPGRAFDGGVRRARARDRFGLRRGQPGGQGLPARGAGERPVDAAGDGIELRK